MIFLIVDLLFDRSYACHVKLTFMFQYVLTMSIVRFFLLLSRGKVVWILWLPHYYWRSCINIWGAPARSQKLNPNFWHIKPMLHYKVCSLWSHFIRFYWSVEWFQLLLLSSFANFCYLFNLSRDIKSLYSYITELGHFIIEPRVSSRTTHVVVEGPKRTLNLLKGIVRGCWVVKVDWVRKNRTENNTFL